MSKELLPELPDMIHQGHSLHLQFSSWQTGSWHPEKKRFTYQSREIESSVYSWEGFPRSSERMDVSPTACNEYLVSRSIFSEEDFQKENKKKEDNKDSFLKKKISKCSCTPAKGRHILKKFFPILDWLPKYRWKDWILSDLVSGISTGLIGTLQALAFALLAEVPAGYGLYSQFYPVLIYFFLGTSKHISVGPFPVISLMVAQVVLSMAPDEHFIVSNSTEFNGTQIDYEARDAARVAISSTFSVLIGIIQLSLGALQLGFVVRYLGDPLVRGFTTAAAIKVVVSQTKLILSLTFTSSNGVLSIVYTVIDIFTNISKTNFADLTAGVITIVVCFIVKDLNERYKHVLRIPIPIEAIVAIVATAISHGINVEEKYNAAIVKNVPSGFIPPVAPDVSMFPQMIVPAICTSIVAYISAVSLGKVYATKHNYEIDGNQEFIAFGISNIFGGCFSCVCATTSLSRTAVQESTGGKTQIAGLITAVIVMICLLSVGTSLEPLQKSVLAAIVIANLKGMLMQVADVPRLWRQNKWDAAIWLFTCIASLLLDIDLGLFSGIIFGLFTILFRVQYSLASSVGNVPGTDIYKDDKKYRNVEEAEGIKIIRISCAIFYGNVDSLKNRIKSIVGFDPVQVFNKRLKAQQGIKKLLTEQKMAAYEKRYRRDSSHEEDLVKDDDFNKAGKKVDTNKINLKIDWNCELPVSVTVPVVTIHSLVLDFGQVSFLDVVAVTSLKGMHKQFKKVDVDVYIAGCNDKVFEQLEACRFFQDDIKPSICFLTTHDAVLHIQKQRNSLRSNGLDMV
ncbi:pendrin-like [Gastrophryne carolinensis]